MVGIEITKHPAAQDGKPVFALLGTHHAREWPSAELTMEFAYDLLRNYGNDVRTTALVDAARTALPSNLGVAGGKPDGERGSLWADRRHGG